MIIHVPDRGFYRTEPIEYLARLVHPNAAVFWDRDMGEHELALRGTVNQPLRFQRFDREWAAFSGQLGRIVARWNSDEKRWVPNLANLALIREENAEIEAKLAESDVAKQQETM